MKILHLQYPNNCLSVAFQQDDLCDRAYDVILAGWERGDKLVQVISAGGTKFAITLVTLQNMMIDVPAVQQQTAPPPAMQGPRAN